MRMPEPASGRSASGAPASDLRDDPAASNGAHAPAGTPPAGGSAADQDGVASHNGKAELAAASQASSQVSTRASNAQARRAKASAVIGLVAATLRRNWLASILVAGGFAMRLITEFAYHPAIIYIDTLKYLYDAWPGSDPVGYKIPLKTILSFGGDLGTVELVQHLLGLAIAVTIYAVLIRRGAPRWLAAIAMIPVLFDAYQLQAEAMIMPDVWFEGLIVAGLAVLLWKPRPSVQVLVVGAALLGASTGVRQVGEILIVPVVIFAIALGGGLVKVLTNTVAVVCAFFLAILLYMGSAYALTHHFRISYSQSSLTYGRMAAVVDCATLKVPPPVNLLCPTKSQQAQGPDWLEHQGNGPLRAFQSKLRPSQQALRGVYVSEFNHAVERQQPLRVIKAILRDSIKLFAVKRGTFPGDTPLWRWQFTGYFPSYGKYVTVKNNAIYIMLPRHSPQVLDPAYGGAPQVNLTLARFLRAYQLNGGYTPGPVFLLSVIAGLAGSVLLFVRRRLTATGRDLALACLCFFTAAVAVLGMSDVFEFTWRYQLPALVTLPPAGALGVAVIMATARRRREAVPGQALPARAPELAAPTQ
jgi:hypothetical protein